jgi:hypothetical protein
LQILETDVNPLEGQAYPGGQLIQSLNAFIPVKGLYVPAGQFTPVLDPKGQYFPCGQKTPAILPVPEQYIPAGQLRQELWPFAGLKVPEGQAV